MADEDKTIDLQISLLKNTKIQVFVDEVLPDLLVVTYEFGMKIFKGILLDSCKRNLPYGVQSINPAFSPIKSNSDEDVLHSVNQRFTYTDPNASNTKNINNKDNNENNNNKNAKLKQKKMTVRLRPRQVLCTKCKAICNENSENVSRKRKLPPAAVSSPPPPLPPPPTTTKRGANAPVTRSTFNANSDKLSGRNLGDVVEKVHRLKPQDISNAVTRYNSDSAPEDSNNQENKQQPTTDQQHSDASNDSHKWTDDSSIKKNAKTGNNKRTLRKKRSVGSMEDLWDESVFEEQRKNNNVNINNNNNSSSGGGNDDQNCNNLAVINAKTIKISFGGREGEGTVLKIPTKINEECRNDDDGSKAARKAFKKAKKKSKHEVVLLTTTTSPSNYVGGASPKSVMSGNSPRYVNSSTTCDIPKRHKHKMKRKKKRKEKKEEREEQEEQEENNTSSSDEHSERVPDFPPSNMSPLVLRMNGQNLNSAVGADGVKLGVGDVVWGKIHGFPWWPGKVLTITSNSSQTNPQAHVSWYGSSTSSLIQCDQLSSYLDNFKIRYNKKKRGPYKEAIRQASTEAKENVENKTNIEPSSTHNSNSIMTVPPPALASPREIDVMS